MSTMGKRKVEKDNVVYLDDYRPSCCKTLACMICGSKRIYVWPMHTHVEEVECKDCKQAGFLFDR